MVRLQASASRLQASASTASAAAHDEAEIPMLNVLRSRFAESAPLSQTVQSSRAPGRVCPSCTVDEQEDVILLDSDSDLRSEGPETEDEEDNSGSDATASTPAAQASGAIPVVLTDSDVLDCPICVEPLSAPIYQCGNGHIACSDCCTKVDYKCPSCGLPISFFNRCRAMEKLVESVTVDCVNKAYGCTETLIYHTKSIHEQSCMHTLCFCPISSCGFSASFKHLYDHFKRKHFFCAVPFSYDNIFQLHVRRNQKHIILKERNGGGIFILNHDIHEHGRVFDVDCLGPKSFKNGFVSQLSVTCLKTCFLVQSVPELCAKWEEHTPKKDCLTIPSEYLHFTIDVCIKKA